MAILMLGEADALHLDTHRSLLRINALKSQW